MRLDGDLLSLAAIDIPVIVFLFSSSFYTTDVVGGFNDQGRVGGKGFKGSGMKTKIAFKIVFLMCLQVAS